jgi:molybdate transport system substrate-binding protein
MKNKTDFRPVSWGKHERLNRRTIIRRWASTLAALSLALPIFGAGCNSSNDLMILCGSSFQSPMEELVAQYEQETGNRAVLVIGGSEDHLPKVKLKQHGDLFVTHSPYQEYTEQADALAREVPVGFLAPALVVKKGNPHEIEKFGDLARPGLKVILPNPKYATCGEMVFALMDKKGIKDEVLENVGNALVRSHDQVAENLKLGHRDVGVMWNGKIYNWRDDIEVVSIPYEYDMEVKVSVMGLSYSDKQEQISKFLDFVEEHGPTVFEKFGYVK